MHDEFGLPYIPEHNDPTRKRLLQPLLVKIHQAEKFVFDSGQDHDEEQVMAVRETAVNMIEAGLFHLPFPTIWVEDPFEDAHEDARFLYLVEETSTEIIIHYFSFHRQSYQRTAFNASTPMPAVAYHPFQLIVPLDDPADQFMVKPTPRLGDLPVFYKMALGEAVYGVKKLLVTLASANPEREMIRANRKAEGRYRDYDRQVIRVPLETPTYDGQPGAGVRHAGKPRRARLIRGYTWGKNTRPPSEQRWIAAYWRQQVFIHEPKPTHYQVG